MSRASSGSLLTFCQSSMASISAVAEIARPLSVITLVSPVHTLKLSTVPPVTTPPETVKLPLNTMLGP